jgi:hypothetical protein
MAARCACPAQPNEDGLPAASEQKFIAARGVLWYFHPMRALLLLASIAVPATAWWLGSFTGLLIAVGVCFALAAAVFAFSRSGKEARESKEVQRAFGRSTTFLAGLRER